MHVVRRVLRVRERVSALACFRRRHRWKSIGIGFIIGTLLVSPRPVSAAAPRAPIPAPACAASLSLVQQPGYSFQGVNEPSSPDTPPDPVTIQVPLYPGAVPADEHVYLPVFSSLASPYLKTAVAEFATTDPMPAVESWYEQQFAACGYSSDGHGTSRDGQGHSSDTIEFSLPGATYQEVAMVFELGDSGRTLILYTAITVSLPARPAASYLPNDIVQVHLDVFRPRSKPANQYIGVTSRRQGEIRRLVHAINSLSVLQGEVHCPITWRATAILYEANGRHILVDDGLCPGVRIEGNPTLADTNSVVRKAIQAIVRNHRRK